MIAFVIAIAFLVCLLCYWTIKKEKEIRKQLKDMELEERGGE